LPVRYAIAGERPKRFTIAGQNMFRQSRLQMSKDLEKLAARAAPAIFVVLWSTGFIATKYVLNSAEPLSYLTIRMAVVVAMMTIIVAVAKPPWPDRAGIFHSVVAGILVHGFYLGGTAVAIAHTIPAGLSALIPGLQPILTSTLANRWLGERVAAVQWTGLVLGLAGVVLILHDRPMSGEAGWGWLASGVSLVSITLGTLYQRRYCNKIDWRAGNLVQYIAVMIFFAIGAGLFEERALDPGVCALGSLACGHAFDRVDWTAVLADPPFGRNFSGEPVLSGASRDGPDGLCSVRRAARRGCDHWHDRLRRRGVSGQPASSNLIEAKAKIPGFNSGDFGRHLTRRDIFRRNARARFPRGFSALTFSPSFSSWQLFCHPSCSLFWRKIFSLPSWISSLLSSSMLLSWRPFSSLPF
jgi:drug/metabolite transporter (DMT)-like permease